VSHNLSFHLACRKNTDFLFPQCGWEAKVHEDTEVYEEAETSSKPKTSTKLVPNSLPGPLDNLDAFMSFVGNLTATEDMHQTIADAYNSLRSKHMAASEAVKERASSQTALRETGVHILQDIKRLLPPDVQPRHLSLVGGLAGPLLGLTGRLCWCHVMLLSQHFTHPRLFTGPIDGFMMDLITYLMGVARGALAPLLLYPLTINDTRDAVRAAHNLMSKVTGWSNVPFSNSPISSHKAVLDQATAERRGSEALQKAMDDLVEAQVVTREDFVTRAR
jgi:hypothetical protein